MPLDRGIVGWATPAEVLFMTCTSDGTVVLAQGRAVIDRAGRR
jgi:hypothetical protein